MDDWKWLANDPRGRRIAADLIESVQLEEDLFNGNSRDAFAEGKRSVGRGILKRVRDASFEKFQLMQKEQHDDRTSRTG